MTSADVISKKNILAYTLLPGILPRVRDMAGSGFYVLARLMAMVFYTVRILPRMHPYLRPENRGKFGLRHVIAAAADHLVISRKNIDQIIIFVAILTALVLLVLQFFMCVMVIFSHPALAASMPQTIEEFFRTPNAKEDLAFKMLNLVFGFPNIFGTGVTVTPFHKALHALFEFYSYGILLVGLMIILYYVITVVAETAQSGDPFGQRFNTTWAPIRLIIFLGCLVPITSYGLNLGQLAALGAAKAGSNLASNGWIKFNEVLTGTYLGDKENMIGTPNPPEMMYLVAYMMIAKTCAIAHQKLYGLEVNALALSAQGVDQGNGTTKDVLKYRSISEGGSTLWATYQNISAASGGSDVHITFGTLEDSFGDDVKVTPVCGKVTIIAGDASEPGSAVMQQGYFNLIKDMWEGAYQIKEYAQNYADNNLPSVTEGNNSNKPRLNDDYKKKTSEQLQERIKKLIDDAVQKQMDSPTLKMETKDGKGIMAYGWGGAGIWYNKVAQMNGAMMSAVQNPPKISLQPAVVEFIRAKKIGQARTVEIKDSANPKLPNGQLIELSPQPEYNMATVLNDIYAYWAENGFRGDALAAQAKLTGNIILDAINIIFGTQGIFNLCKNAKVHPLAQLSMAGKGLIESSIGAFGGSLFFGAVGTLAMAVNKHLASAAGAMSKFFVSVATVGLMAGFILFYVLPFMPFIYFFFAVGSWVKGVFEAMVGIPLWILAHLDIDGEGLTGDTAESGYFIIFEIFIRPILIIFGLLASITIFSALVRVLNEIFYLVIANMTGHDPTDQTSTCFKPPEGTKPTNVEPKSFARGTIDEFFYTIVYAIVVYMTGTSCFKLIDLIPGKMMRWIGKGGEAFDDKRGDSAGDLMQNISAGGSMLSGEVSTGISSMGGSIKSMFKTE